MKKIKQLTVTANYDDIIALSQFAFQYELSETELVKKKAEAERHAIWGWMENNELAAKLHIIPLSSYINGRQVKMGGISSVATWPEYRRGGIVKQLLHHALRQMKEKGQIVSYLHPFSVAFYRKYGWELAFAEKSYSIKVENFKREWEAEGYVRRIEKDIPVLNAIYTDYAKNYTGMLVRDEKWWIQRVLADNDQIAVSYNEENHAEGYIIYNVKENKLTIKEIAYVSLNGWKLLLKFIANHDSMANKVSLIVPENDSLPLLLHEPRFDQKVVPYFMARIVDVFAFLKQYAFRHDTISTPFVLHVEDNFFTENSGTYELIPNGKEMQVTYNQISEDEADLHCSVQMLTTLLLGYNRPLELHQVGLLQGDLKSIEQLEKLIPIQQPFFADFF